MHFKNPKFYSKKKILISILLTPLSCLCLRHFLVSAPINVSSFTCLNTGILPVFNFNCLPWYLATGTGYGSWYIQHISLSFSNFKKSQFLFSIPQSVFKAFWLALFCFLLHLICKNLIFVCPKVNLLQ